MRTILGWLVLAPMTVMLMQAQSTKPKTADIHVYRPKHFVAMGFKPSIYCDGVDLGRLHNGTFLVAKLEPGKHMKTAARTEVGILVDFNQVGSISEGSTTRTGLVLRFQEDSRYSFRRYLGSPHQTSKIVR